MIIECTPAFILIFAHTNVRRHQQFVGETSFAPWSSVSTMGRKPLYQRYDMNIPSSKIDEEFIIVALAVGVCKDIPTQLL